MKPNLFLHSPASSDQEQSFESWCEGNNRLSNNLFYEYGKTLRNSFAGMFPTAHIALELLHTTGTVTGAAANVNVAIETLRKSWFPDYLRAMANAGQFFWQIPDPDVSTYNPQTISKEVLRVLNIASRKSEHGLCDVFADDGDHVQLSTSFGKILQETKKRRIVIRQDGYDTFNLRDDLPGTAWGKRTSSGCPVRHERIGSAAIEQTFSPEQIRLLEERGVIKPAEAGYELFDFMAFAADFVAGHLEDLNELQAA